LYPEIIDSGWSGEVRPWAEGERRQEPHTEARSSRSSWVIQASRQSQRTGFPTRDRAVRRLFRATTHCRSVVSSLPSRLSRRSRGEWRSTFSGRSVRRLSAMCRRTRERSPVKVQDGKKFKTDKGTKSGKSSSRTTFKTDEGTKSGESSRPDVVELV